MCLVCAYGEQYSAHGQCFRSEDFDIVVWVLDKEFKAWSDTAEERVGIEVWHHLLESLSDVETDVRNAVLTHAKNDGKEGICGDLGADQRGQFADDVEHCHTM